jgi:hypothetical protein
MAEKIIALTVPQQVEVALDGRTQRWLSLNARIHETELSKKMNGIIEFTEDEITRINEALKSKIKK